MVYVFAFIDRAFSLQTEIASGIVAVMFMPVDDVRWEPVVHVAVLRY